MIRRALVWGAYPALVAGTMALLFVGIEGRWMPVEWFGSVVVLGAAALIIALERALPDRRRRPRLRTIWVDVLHNLLSSGGVSSLIRAGAFALAAYLAARSTGIVGLGLWPHSWPLGLQLVVALVIGELGSYWAHRLMHGSDALWRLHALHHSPEHLYILASARTHPLNAALVHTLQVAPVILAGASAEVVVLAAGFTAITGLLQHCNVEMETRWLNWIVATPDLHRTHHSTVLSESNSNYGNNIMVWDIIFGTWQPGVRPRDYGVEGVAWPASYLGQMAIPFVYSRLAADADAELAADLEVARLKDHPLEVAGV